MMNSPSSPELILWQVQGTWHHPIGRASHAVLPAMAAGSSAKLRRRCFADEITNPSEFVDLVEAGVTQWFQTESLDTCIHVL